MDCQDPYTELELLRRTARDKQHELATCHDRRRRFELLRERNDALAKLSALREALRRRQS